MKRGRNYDTVIEKLDGERKRWRELNMITTYLKLDPFFL